MLLLYALYPFAIVLLLCMILGIDTWIVIAAEAGLYYWLRARAIKRVRALVQRYTCDEHKVYACKQCFSELR